MCPLEIKRNLVIGLHLEGKSNIQIRRQLPHLKLTELFVFRTIKRYKETGSIKKRFGGGRRCTAIVRGNVEKLRKKLLRNPERSAAQLAIETNISDRSVRRILKNKLQLKPFKKFKSQELTALQRTKRFERSKKLLAMRRSRKLPNLVFSDEKTFCIEHFLNKQNDRKWFSGRSSDHSDDLRITRRQGADQIMVWAAVTENGRSPLLFLPMGRNEVKINQHIYREKVLEGALLPWARKQFGSEPWTFQQDSAPSHKAKGTQNWLKNNVPHFIAHTDWPSSSPDLNPLDYCVWGILQARACAKKHTSLEALKADLVREWKRIGQNVIRESCRSFEKRLKAVVDAKGGYIPDE